jgi:hypothetical protein
MDWKRADSLSPGGDLERVKLPAPPRPVKRIGLSVLSVAAPRLILPRFSSAPTLGSQQQAGGEFQVGRQTVGARPAVASIPAS